MLFSLWSFLPSIVPGVLGSLGGRWEEPSLEKRMVGLEPVGGTRGQLDKVCSSEELLRVFASRYPENSTLFGHCHFSKLRH